jgi:hypothetical protein
MAGTQKLNCKKYMVLLGSRKCDALAAKKGQCWWAEGNGLLFAGKIGTCRLHETDCCLA